MRKRAPAGHRNKKFFLDLRILSSEERRLKGQWFLISAVVASGVFFALSLLMQDYFTTDSSFFAGQNNEHYFYNVAQQFDNIVSTTKTNVACTNLTTKLDELKTTTERELADHGLFVFFEYRIRNNPCSIAGNNVTLDFLVANQNYILYNLTSYTSPAQIIGAA